MRRDRATEREGDREVAHGSLDGSADGLVARLIGAYDTDKGRWAIVPSAGGMRGAIAWARVSTDVQEERGLSIPEQLREIHGYADRRGIEIVGEFREAASAFQDEAKRVEFHRMLAVAKADSGVSLILVHDYSRFTRDSLRAHMLVHELREAGVQVVSLNDPLIDPQTAAGVYMEAITFAKNEAYSREIGFHTRKGCRANIQTRDPETGWCYKNGGPPPWGYRAINVQRGVRKHRPIIKRLWVLDDTQVAGKSLHEWMRYCLIELAGKGAPAHELSSFCRETRLPTEKGRWCPGAWGRRLLPRSLLVYSGFALWGAQRTRRHLSWPPDDWGIVENAHPAIITTDQAAAIAEVRRVLNANHRGWALDCPGLLVTGMITCSRCRRTFVLQGRYYRCSSRSRCRGTGMYVTTPGYHSEQADAAAVSGLRQVMDVVVAQPSLLGTVNDELERAWGLQQSSVAPAVRDHAHCSVPAVLGVDAQLEAAHPAAMLTSEPAHAGVAAADAASEWAAQLPGAPRVDARVLQWCRKRTKAALANGTIREQKYWVRTWVESAVIDADRHTLSLRYRLPHRATSPPGTGSWCARHSATLAGALTRVFPLTPRRR